MKVKQLTKGLWEAEERGFIYTIAEGKFPASGGDCWTVTRIEHEEFFVQNVKRFEQAVNAVMDDALRCDRPKVIEEVMAEYMRAAHGLAIVEVPS